MYGPRMSRMSGNEQNRTTGIVRKNPYAASFTPNTQGSSLAGAGAGDGTFSGYTPGQPAPVVPAAEAPEEVSTFSAQRPGDIPQAKPVDVSGTAAIGTLSKRIEGLQKQLGAYNDPTQSNQEYLDGIKDTIRQNAPTQHYGEMLNQREAEASQARIGDATAAHADRVGRYGNEHYVPQGPLSGMSREEIETRFPAPAQYGPRTTPLGSGKTAEDYNKTSTFQVDDNGEMVLDDEGNPIETEYGRDVARRKRIGEIRAQRGRDRAADRMERAEINRAASPEAQRRLAERRIGKKRFRRLEQEAGTSAALDAVDGGVGTFREERRREAQMADAEAKAQGNRDLSLEEAKRLEAEAARDVEGIRSGDRRHDTDARVSISGDDRDLRRELYMDEQDRIDQRTESEREWQERTYGIRREDEIEDREWTAGQPLRDAQAGLSVHDITSPAALADRAAQQEEEILTPDVLNARSYNNIFGEGEMKGSRAAIAKDVGSRNFISKHELNKDSSIYDVVGAAKKELSRAESPEQKAQAMRSIQHILRVYAAENPNFIKKDRESGWNWFSPRDPGESLYSDDKQSKWAQKIIGADPEDVDFLNSLAGSI